MGKENFVKITKKSEKVSDLQVGNFVNSGTFRLASRKLLYFDKLLKRAFRLIGQCKKSTDGRSCLLIFFRFAGGEEAATRRRKPTRSGKPLRNRKKLVVQYFRRECVYKRTENTNVTFCGKESQGSGRMSRAAARDGASRTLRRRSETTSPRP